MKKLFVVLAVASLGFVACNNDSKTDAEDAAKKVADSTRIADSLKALTPVAPDSTTHHDSGSKMAPDSATKKK
jgi:uncharacterized protein YcfL